MLVAENLVRKYGATTAVDGVSFEVKRGTCFGLLGPNGAGKTSTIGILAGLVYPNAGTVTFDGKPLTPDSFETKCKVGYVPQELAIYEEISATANLEFIAGLYGLQGAERSRRIGKALDIVALGDRATERVSQYSGGMKRRLNIAMSLLNEPELLILDEPTVGVDPQSRNAIFETLESLKSEGLTLLYTTHYMEEVERLCDRIAVMDHGKIVKEDEKAGLLRLLGGQSKVIVDMADEETAQKFAESVRGDGFIVERKGTNVEITADDLSDALTRVAKIAAVQPIESLQTGRATLEEVFLHLTGRSLRD